MSTDIVVAEPATLEFSENLPKTPGWVALKPNEQKDVQEITSDVLKSFQGSNLLALRGAIGVLRMERYLEGKPMFFTDWAESALGPSKSTIFRMKKKITDALGRHAEDSLLYLADHGIPGANNVQLGHIVRALEQVKPIKSTAKAELKGFAESVGEALKRGYSERAKGHRPIAIDDDRATVVAVQTIDRVMPKGTSAEGRGWLRKVCGYTMQKRAITGSFTVEQMKIPDGLFPKRGAPRGPRKKRRKKAA